MRTSAKQAKASPRRAVAAVEFAIVGPVAFLLVLGLISGGLGIFSFQEVGYLAREGSRWASVHGSQYAQETGQPAATAEDVYNNVIVPKALTLDLSRVSYSVVWNASNSPTRAAIVNGQSKTIANTVTVTVTYQWMPTAFLDGMTLSSTSVSTMSY